MDVLTFGRRLVAADPNGAPFSVWQAHDHIGAGICNEPGAYIWNENLSTDLEKAKAFCTDAFGYTYEAFGEPHGDESEYSVVFREGGRTMEDCVGGLGDSKQMGGGDHWLTWFAVEDVDASMVKVERLGGKTVAEPFDTPIGRMSVVQGIESGVFGMIAPNESQQA